MGDRSDHTDDGLRRNDRREGFGDDMGTRVGRPDGAPEPSQQARGTEPGQAGTNRDAVPDGLEGSIMDDDAGARGSGPAQERVQDAARQRQSDEVNRPAGDNRRVDNL